ncbi:Dehydrogenase/reductase SDR family member 4 [Holothuria leucospilota]|uniref:Dehydrogenase/reductase SDR family member 4 n=1 Tax=Holothuria leucospilota TaxID=206669 RepID=A0A9Q1C2D8_HOLLE|nr:Dehydrogenase/reductase SDR family member 4 [Holothuria leucospilota]
MSFHYSDAYLKKRFAGKVAICTASTTGIGFATAERLAREGAKVVVSSRRQENVDAAVKKLRDQNLEVSGTVCHQAKKEDRQSLIDFTLTTYGGIDLLFVSAGVNPHSGYMLNIEETEWEKLFDVNVKSTFLMIRECVPHLIQRGGGAIVTNATVLALHPNLKLASEYLGPYATSKCAVVGLTRALAEPLASHKIRINCIAPGAFKTDFLEGIYKSYLPDQSTIPSFVTRTIMMNRAGNPAECGSAVAFLLSEDASFMTGEVLTVSGGTIFSPDANL